MPWRASSSSLTRLAGSRHRRPAPARYGSRSASPAGRPRRAGASAAPRAPGGARAARGVGVRWRMLASAPAAIDRRQRGGEDEARGGAAQRIDQRGRAGDIAAHGAEGLAERALDDGQAVASTPSRSAMPPPRGAVEPDGMDLVEIGHGAVALGQIADRGDRARCRRPSNRRIRRRRAWAGRPAPRPAARRDAAGRCGGRSASRRRCARMPLIIEAWFSASEKTMQPGSRLRAACRAPPRWRHSPR